MKKNGMVGAITMVVAWFLLMAFPSCVNEEYELSEDRMNLEVTVFEDGLSVPLGSTSKIMLKDLKDSLLANLEDTSYLKYFVVDKDGAYGLSASDRLDLSDTLNSLLSKIEIPDVAISETFAFDLTAADVDDLKVKASEYSYSESLGGMVSVPDFSLQGFGTDFTVETEIYKYKPSAELLKLNLPALGHEASFAYIDQDFTIDDIWINDVPISLDKFADNPLLPAMNISTGFGPDKCHMSFSMSMPEGITSVQDIVLHEGAKVKISVELLNSFFTGGTIMPHIDLDIHEIFHLTDEENAGHDPLTIDHILADFHMPVAGGKVEAVYGIKSLVFNEEDWSMEDGKLTLHKEIDLVVSGDLSYKDVVTTTRHLASLEDLNMDIALNVEFVDFQVDDVKMAIDPVSVEVPAETFSFTQTITLPEQIQSVGHIALSQDSRITMSLVPENMLPGLDLELESLKMTFPQGIEVEGASDGILEYKDIDLSKGYTQSMRILGITLPEPKDGKLVLDKEISVEAVLKAGGVVSSASLPSSKEDDLRMNVGVNAGIAIEDYSVNISGYEYPVSYSQDFEVDVTGMEEFGTVTVSPKGEPVISIEIMMPESDIRIVADPKENLVIAFPQMIRFKDLPQEYNYDQQAGTITIKGEIPSVMNLPIDRLVIAPVKEDGKYWARGEFKVSGGVAIPAGSIDKKDVTALTAPECKVGINVKIPELELGTLEMDRPYTKPITKKFEVGMMSVEDIPEELVSIERVELEEVYFNMQLDASQLPDLGSTKLSLDFNISLPEMIVLDSENVNEDNVLSIKGELDKDGMIRVDPVKIAAIDLSGIDFKKLDELKDTVAIEGQVVLDDVALDIDQWLGKTLEVKVDAGIKDIVISKVTGQVDYQIDPIDLSIDLSVFKEYLEHDNLQINGIENLLSRLSLAADIKTNVGVPMGAEMTITPYSGGNPVEDAVWNTEVVLNHSQSADNVVYTRYWLSNLEEGEDIYRPEGYDHICFPLQQYLSDIPDSLDIRLTAGTDPQQQCVIEPNRDYVVEAAYSAHLPLEFGDGASVTYRDTIPDMPELVGQLLQLGDLVLVGNVSNGLPLEVDMKINLLDSDGSRIPLDESSSSQKINGCTPGGEAVTTEIRIGIQKKDGVQVKDVSAIEVEFTVSTVGGAPLSDSCFIQASLQALVPKGVSVDLGELM